MICFDGSKFQAVWNVYLSYANQDHAHFEKLGIIITAYTKVGYSNRGDGCWEYMYTYGLEQFKISKEVCKLMTNVKQEYL